MEGVDVLWGIIIALCLLAVMFTPILLGSIGKDIERIREILERMVS